MRFEIRLRRWLILIVSASTLLPSSKTNAQEIPQIDVASWCKVHNDFLAEQWNMRNTPAELKSCIAVEKNAYDALKLNWGKYGRAMKENCLDNGYNGHVGITNYELLLDCFIDQMPVPIPYPPVEFQ